MKINAKPPHQIATGFVLPIATGLHLVSRIALTIIVSSVGIGMSLPTLASAPPQFAPTAQGLLNAWKNAIYTNREHSRLTLTLLEPGSSPLERQAEIWYKSKSDGDSRILMRFKSPASIANVAFLSLRTPGQNGADQWLYFPAYKKARRLSSHNRDESFLDSDFSNGDISFEYEDAFDLKLTGSAKLDNQEVYVVEGKVKNGKQENLAYGREVLYFSKATRLNLRSEFFDQNNQLVKRLNVSKWNKYGNRFAADQVEVENMKTKHRSVLTFSQRNLNEVPADRLFTIGELESGR